MPTIYGEGLRAFRRLQLEIMRVSTDHSIFAWQGSALSAGILAESPDQFLAPIHYPIDYEKYVRTFNISQSKPDLSATNFGLHIQMPIVPIPRYPDYYYGFLACSTSKGNMNESGVEFEWPVIYLHRRPGGTMMRLAQTSFQDRFVGKERVLDQEYDTNSLFLLLPEDVWLLSLQRLAREPVLPSSTFPSTSVSDAECTVTFVLAKRHQNIEVIDVCPEVFFTGRNEFSLATLPGDWAMKVEFGRVTFLQVTRNDSRLEAHYGIHYGSKVYVNGRHLATLIVDNGMIGGRMLIVFAITRGAWHLFLSEVSKDWDASACREQLLISGKYRHSSNQNLDSAFSRFVGRSIPFGCEHNLSTHLGKYFVTVERQIRLGYASLVFRITIGLMVRQEIVMGNTYIASRMIFAED